MVAAITTPVRRARAGTRARAECYTLSVTSTNWTLGERISRDPIGTKGGINIYWAMDNAPVNNIDSLGLYTVKKCNIEVLLGHSSSIDPNISNETCSATCVRCCWENKKKVELPIPDTEPPSGEMRSIAEAAAQALKDFDAGVQHADTICKDKNKCCKSVNVEITCHFGWDLLSRMAVPAGVCGKQKTVPCP